MKFKLLILFVNCIINCSAQFIYKEYQFSDLNCHARGITSSKNSIYVSTNIGKVYKINPKNGNYKEAQIHSRKMNGELRDIEFSGGKLIVMESGEKGNLYIENSLVHLGDVFLDGISFYNKVGFAMGDQKNEFFSLYYSLNNGKSWNPCHGKVDAKMGENGFAASGSTVHCVNDTTFVFVTGGMESNLYKSTNRGNQWEKNSIPFEKNESSGAFSLAYKSEFEMVVVGGDYQHPERNYMNCFITKNGGANWDIPINGPSGYRSCILFSKGIYYTCGTNGFEYSKDGGFNWINVNSNNYISMCFMNDSLIITTNKNKIHIYPLNQFK